jgi:hypothetical protein
MNAACSQYTESGDCGAHLHHVAGGLPFTGLAVGLVVLIAVVMIAAGVMLARAVNASSD